MSRGSVNILPDEENVPNLLEVINLVLKKCEVGSKTHNAYYLEGTKFKRHANLGKQSSKLVNECLGSYRFNEAAKLLWVMCQDRSYFDTLLYKGVMVVLENMDLIDKDDTVMKFSCDIQDQGLGTLINKREVHLEYILYALRNNVPDIPSSYKKVTSKRRPQMLKKLPAIDQVLMAYLSLLDYISWCKCCQDDLFVEAENYAEKAVSGFKNVIEHPGIWDLFIIKLIEILEHYEKYKEIEDILKKYVECNPEHVNAYIYICVHLHKYSKDSELFIQYAKVLTKLCPSDVRVLLLVQIWNEQEEARSEESSVKGSSEEKGNARTEEPSVKESSGKRKRGNARTEESSVKKAKKEVAKALCFKIECLKILFKFMDYPVNGNNIFGWQLLSSNLAKFDFKSKSSDTKKIRNEIKSEWKLRCHVWRNIHFNSSTISSGFEDNSELIVHKVKVLTLLEPDHEYIKEALRRIPHLHDPNSSHNGCIPTDDYNVIYRLDDT